MKKGTIWILFLCVVLLFVSIRPDASAENTGLTLMQKVMIKATNRSANNMYTGAMPCRGQAKLLVIDLIDPKEANSISTSEFKSILFGDHYSEGSSTRDQNMTEYFSSVSYGKLHVTGDVIPWYVDSSFNADDVTSFCKILDAVFQTIDVSDYDANHDFYIDGICFLVPDNAVIQNGGSSPFWDYQFGRYSSNQYIFLKGRPYKELATVAHECVHLMGLPDIYANVSLNPCGTHADSIMDGMGASWNNEYGYRATNIPGIMKLFFGWIDSLVEVSDTGTYDLRSYSRYAEAMVIYPLGNTESKSLFFIELVTPHNNDTSLSGSILENGGGLRIWRVRLNLRNDYSVDDYGSPYSYLEAVYNSEQQVGFALHTGDTFTSESNPSSDFFVSLEMGSYYDPYTVYEYMNAVMPKGYIPSGISISDISISGDRASMNIQFNAQSCIVLFYANTSEEISDYQIIQTNTQTALKENSFVNGSKSFTGWNTKPDGTGQSYTDQQIVTIDKYLVLYAQWDNSIKDLHYQWASDYSSVTATYTTTDDDGIEIQKAETVPATMSKFRSPSADQPGFFLFVSDQFSDPALSVQIFEKSIPPFNTVQLLNIPEGVIVIGEEAFSNAMAEAIIIPESCKSIKDYAFSHMKNLQYVLISSKNTDVAPNAFDGCSGYVIDQ